MHTTTHINPEINLASISLPGPAVYEEALRALQQGLNLLIFSSQVPEEDEIALKQEGRRRGLLVMGPDCPTAILDGVGLGFANRVRRGAVGIVGASGTAIQEISSLIHRLGGGVSHAIGTGSNDIGTAVGGSSMLAGLGYLEQDEGTEAIVIVSRPPARATAEVVLQAARNCLKPLVICFLGSSVRGVDEHMAFVRTLHDAAIAAVELLGIESELLETSEHLGVAQARQRFQQRQGAAGWVRGVFSGSELACEAALVLRRRLGSAATNSGAVGLLSLDDPLRSAGHTVLDLGAAPFVVPGQHPMLDPSVRRERFLQEARDPQTAVLLFDLVLGSGLPADPATGLAALVAEARRARGNDLAIIASVCGTDDDPQPRAQQAAKLEAAGALVAPSNGVAAAWAAQITR